MAIKVLILGGTGVLSTGITRACVELGFQVYHFNRGHHPVPPGVIALQGNRYVQSDLEHAGQIQPDVVIDMLGFTSQHAEHVVAAFGGRTRQLIFCSTACVYDFTQIAAPPDEQASTGVRWHYGVGKLACELVYRQAHADRLFNCTIFRPSHVYSDTFFVHQFGFDGALLINRIGQNAPALVFDEGKQLWQACHHDDVGIAFAHACLRERCYGRVYNVGYKETFSWKQCYERIAHAFHTTAHIISLPADTLLLLDAPAYEFLAQVTRYHFAVDPSLLYQDIPEFRQRRTFEEGVLSFWRNHAAGDVPSEYDPLLTELIQTKATTI